MNKIEMRPEFVRGAAEVSAGRHGLAIHRLPSWVREQFPDPQLMAMQAQPSGVHLAFVTEAEHLSLVSHTSRVVYLGLDRPRGCIDVVVDGELYVRDVLSGGDRFEIDMQNGRQQLVTGSSHTSEITLPAGRKRVELWLPHNEALELIELRADAALESYDDDPRQFRWLHHGSSISHGSNASGPTEIWPVAVARAASVRLQNLGFGGSALVDPVIARAIRDTPADLITLKLGINVVNHDAMRLRAFVPAIHGFLDTIREGQAETPIVLISPIFCGIHEATPGPGSIDPASFATGVPKFSASGDPAEVAAGRLTLEVIREALASVVQARSDDAQLHYLDGLELYGAADAAELPLPDNLHPDSEGHALIAARFGERVFAEHGLFWRGAAN
ncbi:SGNH/GDSL hydrolase family protein [Leucobacter sp. UT-8R-CII-1-4]|uniref:GDSL-type esterase/lipase family protein n=1 Tax=Leucobacter sp. UT-8R-CII-1-4 TaxID=3040075 RepID=UPI0024A9ACAE|nr:GDSL-type esterase/lipase family protein [Leucobacter sp. UT-8R-CII-1-4]MDI6023365.1 SGNH/GDSL hydrolase family protein [Leucobacter sp. UT-8R-CII-1-4]